MKYFPEGQQSQNNGCDILQQMKRYDQQLSLKYTQWGYSSHFKELIMQII